MGTGKPKVGRHMIQLAGGASGREEVKGQAWRVGKLVASSNNVHEESSMAGGSNACEGSVKRSMWKTNRMEKAYGSFRIIFFLLR